MAKVNEMAERAGEAIKSTAPDAIRAVGDAFIPGVTLVLDGNVKSGALHFAGGLLGRAVLGPVGWFWAAADSYSLSTTGKHFHQHFFGAKVKRVAG